MAEHKTDINITKTEKYKKPNMTEHKTDMNITKIDKYKKNLTVLLPRNTKLTWTLLKNRAALLRKNT